MVENGYLLIADITGYTSFLSQTAIEHGSGALQSLLNAIIEHIRPPLTISKMEGDAVFAYAPEKSFVQGQTLLEAVEQIYFAFKRTLEENVINTTCDCKACRLIPTLDLKFVLHYGAYTHQQLGERYVELVGTDVNLVHRLMKNHIVEETDITSYLFITQAAAAAMQLGEIIDFMTPHAERYEHLGEITGYVSDMSAAWVKEHEQRRVLLEQDEIWFTLNKDVAAPPSIVWDYLGEPELKVKWHALLTKVRVADREKGRFGAGATHHCSHGLGVTIWYFRDWRPYNYFTYDTIVVPGYISRSTISLKPTASGTHVSYLVSNHKQPESNSFWAHVFFYTVFRWTKGLMAKNLRRDLASLKEVVEGDLDLGRVVAPDIVDVPSDDVLATTKVRFVQDS